MIRLLIAEDERISRQGLSNDVDWAGNGIELLGAAENGMEAYMMALELNPDIIITDIRMPVMDGLQLIEKLHAEMPSVHFMVISAHQEFSYAQQAIKFGVDSYIVKPVDKAELILKVCTVSGKILDKRSELFQKNLDYLLLTNDIPFMQRYNALEDKLVSCCQLLQISQAEQTADEIYRLFDDVSDGQYYLSACVRQLVRLRDTDLSEGSGDVFKGIDSMIENELLTLSHASDILRWQKRKLQEYVNMRRLDSQSRVKQIVHQAETYIMEHYTSSITLKDTATHVYISQQYLSRIFRQEKGVSFIDYLNQIRVEKAKILLRSNDRPITAIAAETGYNDYKYFSNVFKKYTGETPREYRKGNP